MGSADSQNCHRRRKRRRREESRHKYSSTKDNGVLSLGKHQRFKFLLFTCVMNNMICLFLTISLTIPFFSATVHGQEPRPSPAGFLDFENLPVTRFSCDGKVIGGYYADVETGCQMFHVCTLGQKDEIQDIKFLCVNGTVFDQETRVCERVDEVDCSQAEKFYDLNLDLYVPYVTTSKSTEESPSTSTTTTTTTTTTTPTPPPAITFSQFRPMQTYLVSTRFHNTHQHQMHEQPTKPTHHGGNGGKFSSFSYYQRNPPSRDSEDATSSSITPSGFNSNLRQSYLINHNEHIDEPDTNPTGRKVPNGAKTIFYNNHHPTLQKNLTKPTLLTTSTAVPETVSTEESEYYDEEYSDSAGEDVSSDDKDLMAPRNMEHRHSKNLRPNQNSQAMSKENSGMSSGNGTKMGDQHAVYYDDEYGEEAPASEYYDEDHSIINPNEHHFTHVDVPRIPFAKPNEPRVLVTNGKPFLPRLRRQSHHHNTTKHFVKIPTDSSATNLFLY